MQYDDTNKGVLFRERDKKSEKAPDFRGKLNVNGEDFVLVGWTRQSKAGVSFLSIKVEEPRKREEPAELPFNDDIPF